MANSEALNGGGRPHRGWVPVRFVIATIRRWKSRGARHQLIGICILVLALSILFLFGNFASSGLSADKSHKTVLSEALISSLSKRTSAAGGSSVSAACRRKEERRPAAFGKSRALRVYMYDLPRQFTYGMIEQFLQSRNLSTAGKIPADEALDYPNHQHSGEWWLFRDLLKKDGDGANRKTGAQRRPAVRVFDPDDADVFFVPFFSSLCLIVTPVDVSRKLAAEGGDKAETYNVLLQLELLDWLKGQSTWRRRLGRDHVFVAQDPNALDAIRSAIRRSIFLVSDFARLSPEEGNLVKDVVIPYVHRIPSLKEEDGSKLERKTLLFFAGNRFRKDGGRIRDMLFRVLENETDVVITEGVPSKEGTQYARIGMRTSKFCLHPAGDTPSACRMFDAIVNLCIPVIVSDEIELPFEDRLAYDEFCVFVASESAVEPGVLVKLLREIDDNQLVRYQKRLSEVSRLFEYDRPDGAVNLIWEDVAAKLPLVRKLVKRDGRLVKGAKRDCSCTCNRWGSQDFEESQVFVGQNASRDGLAQVPDKNAYHLVRHVRVEPTK